MIRISILTSIVLLSSTPCLMAEEALVLTLKSVGDRVRSQNLELRAARHLIDEALGLQKQAGRLANPRLETSARIDDRNTERGLEVGLSQKFPITARLRLEKDLSATLVEAARKEVAMIENHLVAEARSGLVEVFALRGRLDLLQQQAEVLAKLADFTAEAAKRAEASPIDAGQAKLEKARIEAECLRLEAEIQRAQVELKPLLGMSPQDRLVLTGKLPAIQPEAIHGRHDCPELALAQLEVREAEQLTELERARRLDDVEVGIFAGVERSEDVPDPIEHEGMIGLKLSIPLPLWNRNEGRIEAAEAVANRRKGELQALEQRLGLESATLHEEMQRWAKLATEIEEQLLPQAEAQTELAEKAWRDGQTSMLSVMRSREQGIELAVARLSALKNFHLARVRYLEILGDF